MSIYAEPYPSDGVGMVPDLFTAQKVVNVAIDVDGGETVYDHFKDMLEFEDDGQNYRFKTGIGVAKIRGKIATLWAGMSKLAKTTFLRRQHSIAKRYTEMCDQLLKQEQERGGATLPPPDTGN